MISNDMLKKALGYIRVSSSSQVDNFSPETQREAIQRKAKDLGFEIVKWFEDLGLSAKDTNRPALQEMVAYSSVKKNGVSGVIVYNFSRLNRNTKDFLEIKLLLSKYGVMLISCSEPSGTDSPTEKAIQTILSAVNQLDNENKAIIVATNMKRRFMEGYPLTRPRIGYKTAVVDGRSEHVPDEEWFSTIKTMWHRVKSEKLTLGQTRKILNKLGKRQFSPQFVSKIFSSKFYMGVNVSTKYGEMQGKHKPMVDEETFYVVRQLVTGRKPVKNERHHLREDFPLRGTLVCCGCSNKLSAAWCKGRHAKYPYYACGTRGKHKITSYKADFLLEKFMERVKKLMPTKEMMTFVKEIIREKYESNFNMLQNSSKVVEKDIETIQRTKQMLMEKHLKGLYTDEEFLVMRDKLESEYIVKKGLLSEKHLERIDIETILEWIEYYMTHLDRVWQDATPEGKLAIAGSMFPDGIVANKDGLQTAKIGLGYRLNEVIANYSSPKDGDFEPLLQEYVRIFQEIRPYVTGRN